MQRNYESIYLKKNVQHTNSVKNSFSFLFFKNRKVPTREFIGESMQYEILYQYSGTQLLLNFFNRPPISFSFCFNICILTFSFYLSLVLSCLLRSCNKPSFTSESIQFEVFYHRSNPSEFLQWTSDLVLSYLMYASEHHLPLHFVSHSVY